MISNDDGVGALGLKHLAKIAAEFGDVVVCAPEEAQSGKSSAITVNAPLTVTACPDIAPGVKSYAVNGTPVDCVKAGMHAVFDRKPDLMLSGINHGSNAAVNNIYSGTMGAAMEGCILGIPSIGFSLLDHSPEADFSHITSHIHYIIKQVVENGLPDGICLNVNFPAGCEIKGLKTVRAARGYWTEEYEDFSNPHGKPFYWLTGKFHNEEPDDPETDEYWLARGYGSIVPIRPDQTAKDKIDDIKTLMTENA